METAGDGGAWGIALLALYLDKKVQVGTLENFLNSEIFGAAESLMVEPEENIVEGYEKFLENYKKGLSVEQEAVSYLQNKIKIKEISMV